MKIKKKDFIEIDFVAKTEEGKVFDTTLKEEAEKADLPGAEYKPMNICVGEGQLVKGLDKNLEGKEIGKEYEITLQPDDAFGKRDPKLVKIIPLKVFKEKDVNPYPGLSLAIDSMIVTVRAVSGGRVITDFNHPLSGRKILYKVKILRKLEKNEEKIKVVLLRYLGTDKFSVKEKKIILDTEINEILLKEAEKKIKDLVGNFTIKQKEKQNSEKPPEKKKI